MFFTWQPNKQNEQKLSYFQVFWVKFFAAKNRLRNDWHKEEKFFHSDSNDRSLDKQRRDVSS